MTFFTKPTLLAGLLALAPAALAADPPPVDFARDIRPLLVKNCTSCHGGVKRASNLSFLSRESATAEAKSGHHAIVPGDIEKSELLRRITSTDDEERMPAEMRSRCAGNDEARRPKPEGSPNGE